MSRRLSYDEAREIIQGFVARYDLTIYRARSGRWYLATMSESLFDPQWVCIGSNVYAAAHCLIAAWYDLRADEITGADDLPALSRPGFTNHKEITK